MNHRRAYFQRYYLAKKARRLAGADELTRLAWLKFSQICAASRRALGSP